jgi:hypothetical protein
LFALSVKRRDENFYNIFALKEIRTAQVLTRKGIKEAHHKLSNSGGIVKVQDVEDVLGLMQLS